MTRKRHRAEVNLNDISRSVDSMPILDSRSPEEIVGYNKDGISAQQGTCPPPAVPAESVAENGFDFEAYRKEVLADPKAREVIEMFLKYRHREWELAIGEHQPKGTKRQPPKTQ